MLGTRPALSGSIIQVSNSEYDDGVVAACELVWGQGYLAPGGDGNVANQLEGIDIRGRRVLDLGCGTGGPACALADKYGARVIGSDLEAPLLRRSLDLSQDRGLASRLSLVQVEPGPLAFRDASFAAVLSFGGFTQTEAKLELYRECLRVLEPGGWLSAYDWMRCTGAYSDEMLHWLKTEGLTYALDTPEGGADLLREAGFVEVKVTDRSDWYRAQSRREYEAMKNEHYQSMVELLGPEKADDFVENWRALAEVCERRELLQVYSRARKPGP